MGGCFANRHIQCDSEVESLIRETLFHYNILTRRNIHTLLNEFNSVRKVDSKGEVTEQTYNSKTYLEYLARYINRKNEYEELQKCIPQTFDELFESHLKEKPEYNFLLFAIGFLDEGNKFSKIREIYSYTDQNPESFTYEEFAIFLDDYLTESLSNLTSRFDNHIQGLRDNFLLPGNRLATQYLKQESKRLVDFYSNKDNQTRLKSEVLSQVRRNLKLEGLEFAKVKDHRLTDGDLKSLNSAFGDLFNAIELRHYYWTRFNFYSN